MWKNAANFTVMAATLVSVGTIAFLAVAGKDIPESLERIGQSFGSAAMGLASGVVAATGTAAFVNRDKGES